MQRTITTNCFIIENDRILLGMKKRGFGQGRWNGFGGKLEAGESIEAAAKREMYEEVGIEVLTIGLRGVLEFIYTDKEKIIEAHIFHITSYGGSPIETDEMKPQWFEVAHLPFETMWPDDKFWMPLMLLGKNFKGTFSYEGYDTILHHTLEEII